GRARAARCARTLIRPPGTFSRKREKGCSTGSPASGRRAEVAPLEGTPQRQAAAARRRPAARLRRRPLDCPRSPGRGTPHGLALPAAGTGRLRGRAEDDFGGTGRAVPAGGPGPGHRRGAGAAGPAHRQPEPQREFHHRPGRAAPAARGGRGPARAADRRRRIAAGLGRFRVTVLSVNLNKIAVLRNSRGGVDPDILRAARTCLDAGAHGITVHPRPDARHTREDDVYALAALTAEYGVEFNLEGNPFAPPRPGYPGFLALCERARPAQA